MGAWQFVKNTWKYLVGGARTTSAGNPEYSINFNILDLIAETYATEEFGRGIFFTTEDTKLSAFFLDIVKKNKFDQILWRLIKIKNIQGQALLKFDILKNKDVRIESIEDFAITKSYNELIQSELSHFPIQMIGNRAAEYKIMEFWTAEFVTRFFFYNQKVLSFSMFVDKIPEKFQFDLIKNFNEIKENNQVGYRAKNPYAGGVIPMQLFENIDQNPDLPDADVWNLWLNQTLAEIRYDVLISRPFFKVGSIEKDLKSYIADAGLPKGIFYSENIQTKENQTTFEVIQAPNRIKVLTDSVEFILKMAFNKANSSYATQLEKVPARAEEIANTKGARTVQIKRQIIENDLKIFFTKIFDLTGFKNAKFTLKLLKNAGSESQNIEENIRKRAFGIIDGVTATAETQNIDIEMARKLQTKISQEQKTSDPSDPSKTEVSVPGKTNTEFQKK